MSLIKSSALEYQVTATPATIPREELNESASFLDQHTGYYGDFKKGMDISTR